MQSLKMIILAFAFIYGINNIALAEEVSKKTQCEAYGSYEDSLGQWRICDYSEENNDNYEEYQEEDGDEKSTYDEYQQDDADNGASDSTLIKEGSTHQEY